MCDVIKTSQNIHKPFEIRNTPLLPRCNLRHLGLSYFNTKCSEYICFMFTASLKPSLNVLQGCTTSPTIRIPEVLLWYSTQLQAVSNDAMPFLGLCWVPSILGNSLQFAPYHLLLRLLSGRLTEVYFKITCHSGTFSNQPRAIEKLVWISQGRPQNVAMSEGTTYLGYDKEHQLFVIEPSMQCLFWHPPPCIVYPINKCAFMTCVSIKKARFFKL